jgi:hypothetical protein
MRVARAATLSLQEGAEEQGARWRAACPPQVAQRWFGDVRDSRCEARHPDRWAARHRDLTEPALLGAQTLGSNVCYLSNCHRVTKLICQ